MIWEVWADPTHPTQPMPDPRLEVPERTEHREANRIRVGGECNLSRWHRS